MMEVEVEEDWTSTVTSTPIISPTTGFCSSSELENSAPMFLPPRIRKESERKEREQTKKYKHVSRARTRTNTGMMTCFTCSRYMAPVCWC